MCIYYGCLWKLGKKKQLYGNDIIHWVEILRVGVQMKKYEQHSQPESIVFKAWN